MSFSAPPKGRGEGHLALIVSTYIDYNQTISTYKHIRIITKPNTHNKTNNYD